MTLNIDDSNDTLSWILDTAFLVTILFFCKMLVKIDILTPGIDYATLFFYDQNVISHAHILIIDSCAKDPKMIFFIYQGKIWLRFFKLFLFDWL